MSDEQRAGSDATPIAPEDREARTVRGEAVSLDSAGLGRQVRIVAARLEDDVVAWLAAVGLHEGEDVVVLRRAAFGGPLHVRTASGGEFAVAREIAAKLEVSRLDTRPREDGA